MTRRQQIKHDRREAAKRRRRRALRHLGAETTPKHVYHSFTPAIVYWPGGNR